MRKLFVQALNQKPEWNWREEPNQTEADKIYRSIKKELSYS